MTKSKKDVMTVKEFADQIRKWQVRLAATSTMSGDSTHQVAAGIAKEMDGYLFSIVDRVLAMSKLAA